MLIPVSTAVTVYLAHNGQSPDPAIWTNSFVQFLYFGVGALLAIWLRRRTISLSGYSRIALIVFAVVLALWVNLKFDMKRTDAQPTAAGLAIGYPLIGICCVLIFVALFDAPARVFPRFLIYLGKISYGLYALHWFCGNLVGKFVTNPGLRGATQLLFTIAVAGLSYRFYESRFLRLKKRFEVVRSRPV